MKFGTKFAIAIVISPPVLSATSGCHPTFSDKAKYENGSLVSFSRINYECVANSSCRCTGNHPSNVSENNCWNILGFCKNDVANFPEKCPLPLDANVIYSYGDIILVDENSVYECKAIPNGSYCNNYESEPWAATEGSDWIYLGRCENDFVVSSVRRKAEEDDPPTKDEDARQFTGSFHLAIFEKESTLGGSMLDYTMDDLVLEFIRDNGGGMNYCEVISVQTTEQVVYEELVTDAENTFVLSNVWEMGVTFAMKNVLEEDDDDVENRGGNPCSPQDHCLCCASGSITSSPGKYCKKLGCDLDDCGRKSSMGNDRRRNLRSMKEKDSDYDLSGQDFLNVVEKYTSFKPIGLAVIVNSTNADAVAICSANRFIDDNVEEYFFTCDVFDENDCVNNEDIIFDNDEDVCYSSSHLFV